MSEEAAEHPTRRILLALDASSHGLAALEAAVRLAAELSAELQGLFVEDDRLFRLAGLPFTFEVDYASGAARPLDIAALERALRANAARARHAMARRAEGLQVRWSFEVRRGKITRASLEAGSHADMLIVGRESSSRRARPARRQPRTRQPILVVIDGTPASQRAVNLAAQLARQSHDNVVVLAVQGQPEQQPPLARDVVHWLEKQGVTAVAHEMPTTNADLLIQTVAQQNGKALLVPLDSKLLDEHTMESLLDQLDCPVVLVR